MKNSPLVALFSLFLAVHSAVAAPSSELFFLAGGYKPTANLGHVPNDFDPLRGILATYAFEFGTGCQNDDDTGIQCVLTTALRLGKQCSPEHIALVRATFPDVLPRLGGHPSMPYAGNPSGQTLQNSCYRLDDTINGQETLSSIRVTRHGSLIEVDATGTYLARINGSGIDENGFGFHNVFRVNGRTVTLVAHRDIHPNRAGRAPK